MDTTQTRKEFAVFAVLVLAMAATRSHHFASALHLPDASLAVFFLAGFYLRRVWPVPVLLVEAAVIDYLAITYGGVSDWCVTPAYGFLIPTYATLWYGGRWYAARHRLDGRALLSLAGALLVATTIAFLISNGGFYLFSGRFPDLSFAGYAARVAKYYPPYLVAAAGYVAFAALVHGVLARVIGAGADWNERRAARG